MTLPRVSDQKFIPRLKQHWQEQPSPKPNTSTPTWELVMRDMENRNKAGVEKYWQEQPIPKPNTSTPTWELVMRDMQNRNKAGVEKYGTPLQPNNGRNSLQSFTGFEKPKRTNRKLMHVVDAGLFPDGRDCAHFICPHCGHDDGWSAETMTAAKRGIPCPKCNGEKA